MFPNFSVLLVLLSLIYIASAARPDLDCKLLYNVAFGSIDNSTTVCELKYVKYSAGKRLKFSSNTNDLTYQQLRVKFIESNIQSIPNILFHEFSKLEILELDGVGMRNIYAHSFENADELRALQLHDNKLKILNAFTFAGAPKLEYLDMSSNLLNLINVETFKGLGNLRELSLSNNRISILDEHTFHPLKNLTWIWLDRNEIKIIAVNLLVNSQNLAGIYLNNNKISALSPILFDLLPNLRFLFTADNSCSNQNFINQMIANNSQVKKDLSSCFNEFRTIVPDEEEKYKFKNILRDAEKANAQCETDKAALLERLEATKQQLANLQYKNGK